MHILIFHVPNMIRMYGSLKKFSDQGTVAKFHFSGSAAWCIKKCCNKKGTYNAHTTEQYLTYNLLEQWWQTGGGKKISENFNGSAAKEPNSDIHVAPPKRVLEQDEEELK